MSLKLNYTPLALADISRLIDFIASKAPIAAQRIQSELVSKLANLREFPEAGHLVKGQVRQYVAGDYVSYYLIREEQVVILRIWHQKELRAFQK